MKFLIVFGAVLVIALAQDADLHGMDDVHKKCQSNPETQIDDATFEKLKKHEKFEPPVNLSKHIICMVKGLNMMKEDGKVNVEGVKTHVQHVITNEEIVAKVLKKCAVDEETEKQTAWRIWKCLHKHKVFGSDHHGHNSESTESESDETHDHDHHHGHH